MKRILNKLATLLCCLTAIQTAAAHTMWLETNPKGVAGRPHRVELCFGEFSMADKTPVDRWLEGLWSGIFRVTTPDGQTIDLRAEPSDSCYAASFTPTADGWYRVDYDCLSPTCYHDTELHYLSVCWIRVGTPKTAPAVGTPFFNGLSLLPPAIDAPAANDTIPFPVRLNGTAPERIELNVLADNGWRKNYYRLNGGLLNVVPLWPGRYLLNWTARKEYTPDESAAHKGAKRFYSNHTCFFRVY